MEDSSLYGGLAGVGWALEHVRRTSSDDAVEASDDLDELLLELLGEGAWSSTYDLIGGLVGLGVYALERDGTEPSTRILSLVLDRLSETCERSEIGATWFTRPAWLSPRQRELDPEGHHNLGVSHGIAGIVGLLGHLCDSDAHRSRARALLDEAMRWLLAQQRDFDRARFPILLSPTRTLGPGRLSWCYGDLGIGVTLLDVARRAQRPNWGAVASSLVVNAAARGTAAVNDAGLCHGAFGNAHLFARAYHATSDESLAAAARAWLQIGLDLHGRGTESSYGLLTGVSGIGLALLAASTPLEPAWDRFLLAS